MCFKNSLKTQNTAFYSIFEHKKGTPVYRF